MEIKASLNNLRMAPRKVRLVANLVKGKSAVEAKNQLRFLIKKPAPILLKILNSALANAKNSFNLKEENLLVKSMLVEGGPSLKRWLPRAMGRATPLLKRTCSIKIILEEIVPGERTKKAERSESRKTGSSVQVLPEQKIGKIETEDKKIKPEAKEKKSVIAKPYGASGQAKSRSFSRQTFGNIKKIFRRKSI